MSDDLCGYEFIPTEWERHNSRPAAVAEQWSCPRESVKGADCCAFHLSPAERAEYGVSDQAVSDQLRDELGAGDSEVTPVIGAHLPNIDLCEAIIDKGTNAMVDLRHVEVAGDVTIEGATVKQPLQFDEATVDGTVDCSNSTFTQPTRWDRIRVADGFIGKNATFKDSVSFQDVSVEGESSFRNATFEREADWYGAAIADGITFRQTKWHRGCQFQHADFGDYVDFFFSSFHQRATFQGATFGDTARFSKSIFDEQVSFLGATFEAEALFKKGEFRSHAYFQNVTFKKETSFSEMTFTGKAKFQLSQFQGEASISYAEFEENAYFQRVVFDDYAEFFECTFTDIADFRWTEFHGLGRFMDASFFAEAYFEHAQFLDNADFRDGKFEHLTRFRETVFAQAPLFRRAEIETAEIVNIKPQSGELTLYCEGTEIREGRIRQRDGNKVYYNFREAILGDIDLHLETTTPFNRLLISKTAFEGFDFSRYHYALAPEWDLHTFAGQKEFESHMEASRFALGEREGTEEVSSHHEQETGKSRRKKPQQEVSLISKVKKGFSYPRRALDRMWADIRHAPTLETTYLKAKNGANKVGDSRAASAFFVLEMTYRRNVHIKRALNSSERLGSRIRSLGAATLNWLLALSCGYGEKPYRTLSFSLVIVCLYAIVYMMMLDNSPTDSTFGYLLFSFQSFNAIILGVDTDPFSEVQSFVAASQGFVGAFMIGLFVFTLTRSIHR